MAAPSIDKLQEGGDKYATEVTRIAFKLPTEQTTIGTWNIRTLYSLGKFEELSRELERYQLQVTRKGYQR